MRHLIAPALALAIASTGIALARPHKPAPATCHRTKYRYIDGERVPWDHDEDSHEWEEFDHSVDECVPPPC